MKQLKTKRLSLKEELNDFIIRWNNKFPIDRWWREKYKVPFGSEQHKSMNFIMMFIDYEENEMFHKIERDKDPDNAETFANPNVEKLSTKEIDEEFDNIDISSFNTPKAE
jgi:hypothetical protein